MFDKVSIDSTTQEGDTTICNTYEVLSSFLRKYEKFYDDCHFIIIERQLPQNYKTTRIAQHTITYFCLRIRDTPLLAAIVEVDPKLKGKILGAPKGINDKQLKTWAVEKARELLTIRGDTFSLGVLDCFRNKQDDLSDTVCQIEALVIGWGMKATGPPPVPPSASNSVLSLDLSMASLQLNPPGARNSAVPVSMTISKPPTLLSILPQPSAPNPQILSLEVNNTSTQKSNVPVISTTSVITLTIGK
jgi:hypothetical protein